MDRKWSDELTKEMKLADELKKVITTSECYLEDKEVNKVLCNDLKIKMIKIELMTRSYISKTVLLDASNDNRSVASHREAIALVLSIYW